MVPWTDGFDTPLFQINMVHQFVQKNVLKLPTGMFLNKLSYCKIKGSHSDGAEDSSLLGSSTLFLGE